MNLTCFLTTERAGAGGTFYPTNCDEVFLQLRQLCVKEVDVNLEQMHVIIRYLAANSREGGVFEMLKTGSVDEFYGVKLTLDE